MFTDKTCLQSSTAVHFLFREVNYVCDMTRNMECVQSFCLHSKKHFSQGNALWNAFPLRKSYVSKGICMLQRKKWIEQGTSSLGNAAFYQRNGAHMLKYRAFFLKRNCGCQRNSTGFFMTKLYFMKGIVLGSFDQECWSMVCFFLVGEAAIVQEMVHVFMNKYKRESCTSQQVNQNWGKGSRVTPWRTA